ncbi:MAG: hypothetical protein HUU38_02120 [Anaerolineales bacterium]|nr:hypothetical protein [Anaerolineales bacterium]
MTDFLNHLVTRSLHPETSLQPRPVSRYEQGFDPIPAPVEPTPAWSSGEDRTAPPPARPIPRPSLPRAEFTTPPEPRSFPQSNPPTPAQTLPPSPPATPIPAPHRGRLDAPERVETLLHTHTLRERIIERPILPAPINPAPPITPPPTETPRKEPPPPAITPIAEHLTPTQPRPTPLAPKAPAFKLPEPTVITPVLRPVLPDILPAPKASAPAPTIHVTIGRVEVRATPASAPTPSRPAKTPSVMTLDEYLLRKNTGGEP